MATSRSVAQALDLFLYYVSIGVGSGVRIFKILYYSLRQFHMPTAHLTTVVHLDE